MGRGGDARREPGRAAVSLQQLVLITFVYLLSEWLFLATKPSFLSLLPFREQVLILFVAALPFLGYGLAFQLPILLADYGLRRRAALLPLAAVVPALIATALALVQLDTFTYTLFGFGIVHATGLPRYLYLAGSIAAVLYLTRYLGREQAGLTRRRFRLRAIAALALASLSIVLSLVRGAAPAPGADLAGDLEAFAAGDPGLPNVVLVAADGVDADHLSIYGYERQTSPRLDAFFADALMVENAVANSSVTSGSLTSMLTGKLPTTTKLIFGPPHVLRGADAYQHLPGILKRLGYDTFQETLRHWGDAADRNMLEAFDVVNGREVSGSGLPGLSGGLAARFAWEKLFHDRLLDRIVQRARHVLGLERMEDTFGMVRPLSQEDVWGTGDETRVARTLELMSESAGPFFVHLHLLGTHCCPHRPEQRSFSAGADESALGSREEWTAHHRDLYDDTILSADRHLGRIFDWLESSGELDDTIVVFSSDHTSWWDINRRIPVLFRFPRGEHRGRVRQTAQLLDVAPTLLDYLGLETPVWMEGDSLLRPEEIRAMRPIFATWPWTPNLADESWQTDLDWGPPFYGVEVLGLALCHRWYRVNLDTGAGSMDEIPNHTAPCATGELPSDPEIRSMIAGHLAARGFR